MLKEVRQPEMGELIQDDPSFLFSPLPESINDEGVVGQYFGDMGQDDLFALFEARRIVQEEQFAETPATSLSPIGEPMQMVPNSSSASSNSERPTTLGVIQEPSQKNDDFISQAWEFFKGKFAALQEADTLMGEMHMMVCTGADGHLVSTNKSKAPSVSEDAMATAFMNVLNTVGEAGLRELVDGTGEDTSKIDRAVTEVAAATWDRFTGGNTYATVQEMYNSGMAFASHEMANRMMADHVHGAGCNHGGEGAVFASGMPASGSFSLGGGSSLGRTNHEHEHDHDTPTHKCSGCGKEYHIHGESGVCKKCRGKLNPIKKRRLH